MATKEQGEAVKRASDLILEAIETLSENRIQNAELDTEAGSIQIALRGDDNYIRLSFTAQRIAQGDRIEDDSPPTKNEKLPGMTPSRAPERPIDIDKGDLS
jgi:hypothetical protein